MKCPSCNLEVLSPSNFCPLCQKKLDSPLQSHPCDYPFVKVKKTGTAKKISFFFGCLLGTVSVILNFYTWKKIPMVWSALVISGLLFLYKSVFNWVSQRRNIGAKLFTQFIWLSQCIVALDVVLDFSGWSINYTIPWFAICVTAIMSISAFVNRKNITEYMGHMIAVFGMTIVLFLLTLLPSKKVHWVAYTAILYSLFTFFAIFLFAHQDFKDEIKKRLHW